MKTLLLFSILILASACVQKEPVRVKANPALKGETLIDLAEEAEMKELKGFKCDMTTDDGQSRVFLQFTKKSNGQRRLHVRNLLNEDTAESSYPVIAGYRLLPVSLTKESREKINFAGDAEIVETERDGLTVKSASGQMELEREGDSFHGRIEIAYKAGNNEGVRLVATLLVAELDKCTGPETVKMGTN